MADDLRTVRELLAEQRAAGRSFGEAWPEVLAAVDPATRDALAATAMAWAAAWRRDRGPTRWAAELRRIPDDGPSVRFVGHRDWRA